MGAHDPYNIKLHKCLIILFYIKTNRRDDDDAMK